LGDPCPAITQVPAPALDPALECLLAGQELDNPPAWQPIWFSECVRLACSAPAIT
jgi:hypothetical protein